MGAADDAVARRAASACASANSSVSNSVMRRKSARSGFGPGDDPAAGHRPRLVHEGDDAPILEELSEEAERGPAPLSEEWPEGADEVHARVVVADELKAIAEATGAELVALPRGEHSGHPIAWKRSSTGPPRRKRDRSRAVKRRELRWRSVGPRIAPVARGQ